jgi:flavin-dependent dehydrogenase
MSLEPTALASDVAIVGAGPAGAVLAARLAHAGLRVTVLERSPTWHWRAGGVFASPAAVTALERAGVDAATIERVALPIPAMRVETPGGATFRLTYGAEATGRPAVGFDRSALDPALVDLAEAAGATVRRGVSLTETDVTRLRAEVPVVVGADGAHSIVARALGVARRVRLAPRIGLTYHLPDPRGDLARDARMRIFDDGYVGIAPVPGSRVNVGIVLGPSWRSRLVADGAARVADGIVGAIPPTEDDPAPWRGAAPCERPAGAAPLGVRVTRRAGPGWFLVGDAAGFLDPFTGEGLHRALVSTELAAPAIVAVVAGRATPARAAGAYDRAMRRRFAAKDAVSWLVQAFLGRPGMFEYAAQRVASRPDVRATMGLVMGDLVPATRGLDPRFLAALLRP